jgi:hypothetical protein
MDLPKKGKLSYNGLKLRIPGIQSLSMMKMEKNFIALEKGYPRQPYFFHTIENLLTHLEAEVKELRDAFTQNDSVNIREEIADISNICDYLYEKTLQ